MIVGGHDKRNQRLKRLLVQKPQPAAILHPLFQDTVAAIRKQCSIIPFQVEVTLPYPLKILLRTWIKARALRHFFHTQIPPVRHAFIGVRPAWEKAEGLPVFKDMPRLETPCTHQRGAIFIGYIHIL